MLSFTDWAIDRAEEVMLELGIADKCGFNKNGWMQLSLASPGATLPTSSKVCCVFQSLHGDGVMENINLIDITSH